MLSAKMKNDQTLVRAQRTNSTKLRLKLNLKQLDVSNQHMPQASDKHLNQSNFYVAVIDNQLPGKVNLYVTQTIRLKH